MIKFAEEKVTDKLLDEIYPLLERHAEELNVFSVPLSIDRMAYLMASAIGHLAAYIARDDGKIAGYVVYWIRTHPHYELETAQQDILFLDKEYRRGSTGIKMIKYSEKKLKEDYGVDAVLQHTKIHQPLDKLFEFLGYKEADKIYCKEL